MTKIHFFIISLFVIAFLSACGGTSSYQKSKDEQKWQPLFTGNSLDHWVVKCKPEDQHKQFWKIEDGTILADSMGFTKHDYVWLTTQQEYSDFALKLKFQPYRFSPGNSGIQVRSRYDNQAGWLDGPQIDINPPGPWRTGMMWDETRGVQRWIFPNIPKGEWVDQSMVENERIFLYGDDGDLWNDLEITAIGTRITAVLNGIEITDFDGRGILNDTVHKKYNVGMEGVIALQIHKGDQLKIRFKDIAIQDLTR